MIRLNHYGQALIEFVLLLPIFVFMLFALIDLGKLFYLKNSMESKMEDVITIYSTEKNIAYVQEKLNLTKEKMDLKIQNEENYLHFFLEKEIDFITPGFHLIFKNPYKIETKRVISYE